MKKLWLIFVLLLSTIPLMSQNVRFDPQPVTTASHTGGQLNPVLAIPNAGISFYTGCTSIPCSTYASTYPTASSTTSCPASAQVVLQTTSSCIATSDEQGNFGAWFLPGQYQYVITALGNTYGPYYFTVAPTITTTNGVVPFPPITSPSVDNVLWADGFAVGSDEGAKINAAFAFQAGTSSSPTSAVEVDLSPNATYSYSTPFIIPNATSSPYIQQPILDCHGATLIFTGSGEGFTIMGENASGYSGEMRHCNIIFQNSSATAHLWSRLMWRMTDNTFSLGTTGITIDNDLAHGGPGYTEDQFWYKNTINVNAGGSALSLVQDPSIYGNTSIGSFYYNTFIGLRLSLNGSNSVGFNLTNNTGGVTPFVQMVGNTIDIHANLGGSSDSIFLLGVSGTVSRGSVNITGENDGPGTVTTTANASISSTTIIVPSASSIVVGEAVSGTGIAPGTFTTGVSGTTIALNIPTTTAISSSSIATTATASSGATTITVASSTSIIVGDSASGTGIAPGTFVTGVSGTTITLGIATTSSLSSTIVSFTNSVTFSPVQYDVYAQGTSATFMNFGHSYLTGTIHGYNANVPLSNITWLAGPAPISDDLGSSTLATRTLSSEPQSINSARMCGNFVVGNTTAFLLANYDPAPDCVFEIAKRSTTNTWPDVDHAGSSGNPITSIFYVDNYSGGVGIGPGWGNPAATPGATEPPNTLSVNGTVGVSGAITGGSISTTGSVSGATVAATGAVSGSNVFPTSSVSFVGLASGITSVVCTTGYTCNSGSGYITIVSTTFTTGNMFTISWAATKTASQCIVGQAGGSTFLGFNDPDSPSTTGFFPSVTNTIASTTVNMWYSCKSTQ